MTELSRATREARTLALWKGYAGDQGETMAVQQIGGYLYGFGSELACLRIYHRYASMWVNPQNFAYGYSQNRGEHYFRLDINE